MCIECSIVVQNWCQQSNLVIETWTPWIFFMSLNSNGSGYRFGFFRKGVSLQIQVSTTWTYLHADLRVFYVYSWFNFCLKNTECDQWVVSSADKLYVPMNIEYQHSVCITTSPLRGTGVVFSVYKPEICLLPSPIVSSHNSIVNDLYPRLQWEERSHNKLLHYNRSWSYSITRLLRDPRWDDKQSAQMNISLYVTCLAVSAV